MVELVDTQDLKSCSRKRSAGSIPALSTKPDTKVSGFVVDNPLRNNENYQKSVCYFKDVMTTIFIYNDMHIFVRDLTLIKNNMCRVYNQIGCLTAIQSHLHKHNVKYTSLQELINFQENYPAARQQIISFHKLLIEQEKNSLCDEIVQLDSAIETKKYEVEQHLLVELEQLKHRLDNLSSVHTNLIHTFINSIKRIYFGAKIRNGKRLFNFKIENSLKYLTKINHTKIKRYQYIIMNFDDAVIKSGTVEIQNLDKKKRVIDQINNSIYGALGELEVVTKLQNLPDDYILINDFSLSFNKPIYNRKENYYIQSIQMDHILVAPSGVFLIETKNWSKHSVENHNLWSPVQQIKRANFALYIILNGKTSILNKHHWGDRQIPIKNLIVLTKHKPIEKFQYVKVLNINELFSYINYFEPCFSIRETQTIADYLLSLIS